ncbi:zinc-binding dehydrogenase [Actinomadura sp. DC4]|uniref:zinc-binding dehydrogenase n=1 Tax=Actinomadura sp. DC4 TaxID=3055069 RepID=UPI0025B23121|nr:zinc-binding dehydrogenase [Actinomadura sp. DC4]MDN3359413.1 zinc-binding dehydrogenase [Actinomadura sp. DC4]
MRVYELSGVSHLTMVDRPDPECDTDGIVVETEAVTICSTDVSYFLGHLIPEQWPVVPGHEYVGRVVEVGSAMRGTVREGDRITYWGQTDFGGLAEYRAVRPLFPQDARSESTWYTGRGFLDARQAATVVLPSHLPVRHATLIEPLTSVLRAILMYPPLPGDVAVVLGAGPTGLLATQVLRRCHGAGRVVVVERDPIRRAAAARLGADATFDPDTQADALRGLAEDHLGAFADYVFDALPTVGGSVLGHDVRAAGMRLLRAGGRYVIFGATNVPQSVDTWLLLSKGLRINAAPFDVRAFPMSRTAHVMRVALNLLAGGLLDVDSLITGVVEFHDEDGVRDVFSAYGENGALKTSVGFDQNGVRPITAHDALASSH